MTPGTLTWRQLFFLVRAESRGARRRFVFFVLCLAIGVGAVMSVKSFSHRLQTAIRHESKNLLAADIEIGGSWGESARDIQRQSDVLPPGTEFAFIKELHGMARFASAGKIESLLVELKAVPVTPPLYPLYGKLNIKPAGALPDLLKDGGALVEPAFLLRSGLHPGDRFQLGRTEVRIAGELLAEPDRIARAFSIGPRVVISLETLAAAGLVQPGSRVRHRTLVKLPESAGLDRSVALLKANLSDKSLNVRTYKMTESSLTAAVDRIGQYFGALGVIALMMGGIGVAMIVRAFLTQKMNTIAILHCLGATPRAIFKVYLAQTLLISGLGGVLGVAAGYGAQFLLPAKLTGLMNIAVRPEFDAAAAARALLLGLATALLFSLWPLLRAVKTRPLRLFRHIAEEEELARGSRRERWVAGTGLAFAALALIFWQAESVRQGWVFLGALAGSVLVLGGVSALALKGMRHLPASRRMSWRYSIANLHRPNNQAVAIVTALGMGLMLVLTVRLVQTDMIAMLRATGENAPPNYFFIDIQKEQREEFIRGLQATAPGAAWELTPLVRARLYDVDGRLAARWVYKDRHDEEWFVNREFVLTYTGGPPPPGNEIVAGRWWSGAEAATPQVSLEEDAAKRLGARIGSRLVMDIQGVRIAAPVTSVRRVDWRNLRTNFYMIYSPGALDGAPITFVGTVRVPPEAEPALRQAVTRALPNVTAISTRDIADTVQSVTGKLLRLVDFMSAFTIAAGLFVLSGAIASTRYRRLQEAAVLKTLGATRRTVAVILGGEYAVLGMLASLTGAALSTALSWAIMKYLVEAEWRFHALPVFGSVALGVALTVAAGVLSSLDVLRAKPLETLREA